MAKKSKSKKRKQAQKRTTTKTVASTKSVLAVEPEVADDSSVESSNIDEMMNEAVPRQPLDQKWIIVALAAMIALLGIVLWVMYQKTNDLKQNTTNTGQDQLLNVHASDQDSLQPTTPQNGSSTPQNAADPQNSTDSNSANQLQPQSSPTPTQLNNMQ
jgi:hypothetical protein